MRRAPRSRPLRSHALLPPGPLLVLLPFLACAQAGKEPVDIRPPAESPLNVIRARVAAGRNPGIVLGIVDDSGTRVYAAGTSGRAGLVLDGRTLFEIGSITKVFTATLLVDAVRRDEVRLEVPVKELLPAGVGVPSLGGRAITLVDLATHTSGLPRNPLNMTPADADNPFADYSVPQLYQFLASYALPRAPGASYEYSNVGMGLLGHALARRAGAEYEQVLRERVLDPLGLSDTRITLEPALAARFAQGHTWTGAPASSWELPTLAGAGALRSDAEDMLRFLAANLTDRGTALAGTFAATRRPRVTVSPTMAVGLAWHIDSRTGHPIVWHNGGTGGFCAFAGYDTATRRGVVVLTNSNQSVDDIGFHFLDARYPLSAPTASTRVPISAGEPGRRPDPAPSAHRALTVAPGPERAVPGTIGMAGAPPAPGESQAGRPNVAGERPRSRRTFRTGEVAGAAPGPWPDGAGRRRE